MVKKSKPKNSSKTTTKEPSTKKKAPLAVPNVKPKVEDNICYDLDFMYKGGTNRWLIITLSEETMIEEHYQSIAYELTNVFGSDTKYFIPIYREQLGSKEISLVLFDGYVFVQEPKEGFHEIDFNKLRTAHVKSPLGQDRGFKFVKNKDINSFKRELKKKIKSRVPKIGEVVIPKQGVFKDLEGTVMSIDKNRMVLMVKFETSSRVVQAPVPFINVDYE